MINLENMKFGDTVYIAKETNNSFSAKRITMVDADGNEWHRYDRDRWTFSIEEITYCGKVTFIEEGDVRFDEERFTEYHFRYPDGQIYYEQEGTDEHHLEHWFYTKDEAEILIEELKLTRGT